MPIELTPAEYFETFVDGKQFIDPDEVLINDLKQRGNVEKNIAEVFPDAQVIEYYDAGTEEFTGIDWSGLILVYERDSAGKLMLVAIIHDMWTI